MASLPIKKMRGGPRHGVGSPNPRAKFKDSRSDWRHSPHPHRPRCSFSPQSRTCPRSISPQQHGYYTSRRLDHGKQPMSHPGPTHGDAGDYDYLPNYVLPGHSPDHLLMESKPPRSIIDVNFHHQGGGGNLTQSSSRPTGQDMFLQKSMFLDEVSNPRNYYTLPPDTGYLSGTTMLKSESIGGSTVNLNSGTREMVRSQLRDPYDERDRGKVYNRDASFTSVPPADTRPFGGTSSSSFMKDDLLDLYRNQLHHPSDRFGKGGGVSKYSRDPFEEKERSQFHLSDPMRRDIFISPDRDGHQNYSYHELGRNERVEHRYLETENTSKILPWGRRGDVSDTAGSPFLTLAEDGLVGTEAPRNNLFESSLWNQHGHFFEDASLDYCDRKVVDENRVGGSGNGREYRTKSSRSNDIAPFDERYTFGRGAALTVYKGRQGSPQLSDHDVDLYRQGVNPHRGSSHMDDLDLYDVPYERKTTRREYMIDENKTKSTLRNMPSNDRRVFKRVRSSIDREEIWHNENRIEFPPPKNMPYEHSLQRKPGSRVARSDAWLQSGDSSGYVEGGRSTSLAKRLRPGPSEFHGPFLSERKRGFFRPHKFWKRGFEDRHGGFNASQGDSLKNDAPLAKTDPPEGSEEFKHQVHKAFLWFSKVLNESPHQQKRYREQGKAGNLLCCVCGSNSKEFVDTHSLVSHAYYSLKAGWRTEHLGFHKALCLLMDWNWLMAPEGKTYQLKPLAEAKELKEDLILWPPVVIVHNSSIGKKINTDGTRVVPVEHIEGMLREMGFGEGKTRVGRGKPANQSVFLVKFMPTFSGLLEAERLHKHYIGNNRGRQEFQQIASDRTGSNEAREVHIEKVEDLLYGYMAVAEDMDKLDAETKKRCLVKSRKDIEAIADAPLNTD